MSIPVPRAPKARFAAPERPVPAPEEVSAGGLIIDFDRPNELPVAIIARINRIGQREWCLPKGHIEHGETLIEAAGREIAEETGITGYPVAALGTIAYWFTSNGLRIHKTVHHYLFAATGGTLTIDNDPDHEAIDVAWVPLTELPVRLSFANEQHIARSASEYITTHL